MEVVGIRELKGLMPLPGKLRDVVLKGVPSLLCAELSMRGQDTWPREQLPQAVTVKSVAEPRIELEFLSFFP